MKKILTTILAGTLVAGAAFAADAKITLNFRSRLNALAMSSVESGDKTTTTRDWMNWDNNRAYNGAGSDTFKFVLNGDRAGATFAVNLATATGTGLFTLNEYSAWMNFPVGPGTLTLRTGNWKDGYADGNYRVKKDVEAQNGEGVDFEKFKLGSIFKGSQQLLFVDDLAKPANNKAIAGFADYGFDVNDNVNLNILVGGVSSGDYVAVKNHTADDYFVDNKGNPTKGHFDLVVDGDTVVTWNSAFVSRAQVKVKDVLNAELIYKLSHATGKSLYHTFGLYVMPQVLDALTLNVGGAAEVYGGDHGKDDTDYFDWGVDLRMRYQVMDALSVTFFTNVSGTSLDKGRAINAGNTGYKGSYGYIAPFQNKIDNKDVNPFGFTARNFKVAMWNNLSARYKINDLLTATLNVGLVTPLSKAEVKNDNDTETYTDKNSYSPEWRVTPAVQIYAASNASLWAGVAISGASWTTADGKTDNSAICVEIPVIFRVKM
ncbi:MAG: hypothetical protein K2K67_07320 [Treponemataceae bacterium]|nr:hypothetical protein [Treponemataceae bacterium]